MQKNILQTMIIATLPILAYIFVDVFFENIILSIGIAVGIGLIEFIITLIIYKKLDYIIFIDIALISVLGLISILFKDSIFFKLKPAVIEMVLLGFILTIGLSKKFFTRFTSRYLKNNMIDEKKIEEMQVMTLYFVPVLLLHIVLIVISAFFMSEKIWAFVSSFLLYIFMGLIVLAMVTAKFARQKIFEFKYRNAEWFDIVDEKSRVIGKAPREICHNGSMLLHPVVHVHIINQEKKLLLQKRAITKKIQPGKWDTSVGGHISSGEPLIDALKREVSEEAGILPDEKRLIPVNNYVYQSDIERELVFSFAYLTDETITFQESEIERVDFFELDDVQKLIMKNETTPNFIKEFDLLRNHSIIKDLLGI